MIKHKSKKKTLLLIVDVQAGFINNYTKDVVDKIKTAKDKIEYDTCIVTRFCNDATSSFYDFLGWKRLTTPEEQQIVIACDDNDVIATKNTYSALTDEVKEILLNGEYDMVYICGVDTDSCVMATAFDFFDIGIKPVIISDCCASSGGKQLHDAAMVIMRRTFGEKNIVNLTDLYVEDK